MKLVILESPYSAKSGLMDVKKNVAYERKCLLDSLKRDEAPIASHLLYTQVLDDDVLIERGMGIAAGLAWVEVAETSVFYIDNGWSKGMKYALGLLIKKGKSFECRSTNNDVDKIHPAYIFQIDNGFRKEDEQKLWDCVENNILFKTVTTQTYKKDLE
jgi:hypothetical protein